VADRSVLRTAIAAFALVAAAFARPAHAEEDPPKRPLPNYDGRGEAPTTAGDVALWVPRILLSPLYLASEYVIRRPLGWLITTAERNAWAPAIIEFFTFGPDHKAGIVPTAFLEYNFRPSVGLYFFADDAFWKKNDLRIHAQIGGTDWISVGGLDRVHLGKFSLVGLGSDFLRRPDYVFHGVGPRSLESDRSRFTMITVDSALSYDLIPTTGVRFQARVGVKTAKFGDGTFDEDPTLSQEARRGVFALPPGFPQGYTSLYQRLDLALDSRKPRPASGTGVRVAGHFDHGADARENPGPSWIRYGGTLGGFWDVTGQARTLGLVVNTEFAKSVRNGPVPFTEQVLLGGYGAMSGFRPGRLVGASAATAALIYEWPIWVWLDGSIRVAAGNVFDSGLRDFDPKLLRLSSAIGIRSTSNPDHQIEFEIGIGTETFDQGANVSSFRLAFGGTNGF
jgi:hypothetical protein